VTQWLLVVLYIGSSDGGVTLWTERMQTNAECNTVGAAFTDLYAKNRGGWGATNFSWKCVEVAK
jgi:hypothetical protein